MVYLPPVDYIINIYFTFFLTRSDFFQLVTCYVSSDQPRYAISRLASGKARGGYCGIDPKHLFRCSRYVFGTIEVQANTFICIGVYSFRQYSVKACLIFVLRHRLFSLLLSPNAAMYSFRHVLHYNAE